MLAAEALGLLTRLGDAGGRAEAMWVLGTVAMNGFRYTEAAEFFTTSAELHRDCGAEPITARALGGLGAALLNLGDLARARAALDEALVVIRRYEDRWGLAIVLLFIGHVDLAEGDIAHAQAALSEAGSLFQETGNMVYLPSYLGGLVELAAAQGDFERAASWPVPGTHSASRSACSSRFTRPGSCRPSISPKAASPQRPSTRRTPGLPT